MKQQFTLIMIANKLERSLPPFVLPVPFLESLDIILGNADRLAYSQAADVLILDQLIHLGFADPEDFSNFGYGIVFVHLIRFSTGIPVMSEIRSAVWAPNLRLPLK